MFAKSLAVFATVLAVASATPCKPVTKTPTLSPTLPTTGSGTDLPAPPAGQTLLKIAVGHGLQNYTCDNSSATVVATGALAVLYDVTSLFPGTAGASLAADVFDHLSATSLWTQSLPLNLQHAEAGSPGSPSKPNALAEALYGAVVGGPFPSSTDGLSLPGVLAAPAPFLGRHYFDASGAPTFDLSAANLLASLSKAANVKAPASADKGILGTGAVDWLQLKDNGKGISKGVSTVYRVLTVGGASQTCAALNASAGSVPYAAFYWFFG